MISSFTILIDPCNLVQIVFVPTFRILIYLRLSIRYRHRHIACAANLVEFHFLQLIYHGIMDGKVPNKFTVVI